MNGAEAFLATLREAGVRYLFGTPGTTEVPLIDALVAQEDIQFVLTMHESIAVGMADGLARASGGQGVVSVHATIGTANTLGILINSYTDGVPVVVTAGIKDQRALGTGVFCDSPFQVTDLLRQYTKWSWQVLDAAYVGRDLSKALRLSESPVQGPVYIGIPENFWTEPSQVGTVLSKGSTSQYRGDFDSINRAIELLHKSTNPIMMVGNEVGRTGALAEAVALAEHWQIPVFTEERNAWTNLNFPTDHPLYISNFNYKADLIKKADVVLSIGVRMFMPAGFQTIQHFSPETQVIQIYSDPSRITSHVKVAVGIISEARMALQDLLEVSQNLVIDYNARMNQLEEISKLKSAKELAQQELLAGAQNSERIKVQHLVTELSRQASKNVAIVDEGVRSGKYLQDYFNFTQQRSYFGNTGGCLGWGVPAAMGVKLANPEREVIAFVGDGSFLFSPQALWTAAHYEIGIKVIICNNSAYMAVKGGLLQFKGHAATSGKYIGCDFTEPELNYTSLCQGFGVPVWRAILPTELPEKIHQLLSHKGTGVLEVVIDPRDMEKQLE